MAPAGFDIAREGFARRQGFVAALAVCALGCVLGSAPPEAPTGPHRDGARAIETRLLAPCCWTQTLDVHDSELAASLRAEITARVDRGEPPRTIEDDLVARYGERLRATPRDRDPLRELPVVLAGAMGVALVGLLAVVARWSRRAAAPSQSAPVGPTPARSAPAPYDAAIDAALARDEEGA